MLGTTIGHYTIEEKLGEGGMGVVYKALDTKLNRPVALKFLPEHIQKAEKETERFLQEAQAAASLSHANICTIHGIEDIEGNPSTGLGARQFIVMEFVDGQMLQEKIHSLPRKQALEIAVQIADGLAAAHEKGIIHRDIKPENIMIRKDGTVQIMDFGLAKLRGATRLTKEGSTVGTAGYMSPEQVQGMDVDHRSDIFSLGVLLYEMLAGQSPFRGVHETAIIYEIVNVDPPPLTSVKTDIDPELDALVLDCLAKDPADRYQSAAELARTLRRFRRGSSRTRVSRVSSVRTPSGAPPLSGHTEAESSGRPKHLPTVGLGIIAVLSTIAALYLGLTSSMNGVPSVAANILPPPETELHPYGFMSGPVVVSPDGSMLVYSAMTMEGVSHLYLRHLNSLESTEIPGSEGAYYPFWSPDSRWIAFFTSPGGKLKKADIFGNPPISICDAVNCRGGTWNQDDMIVFSPLPTGALAKVPASGGDPVFVTRIDTSRNETSHRWPFFLPDGKRFLYFSRTISFGREAEGDAIAVGDLDGGAPTFILQTTANAMYASGYLLSIRGSSLIAQRFDPDDLTLDESAATIAENVTTDPGFSLSTFSASGNGILAYHTGEGKAGARMLIVDRKGEKISYVGGIYENFWPEISPDQHRVVSSVFDAQSRTQNLWMHDLRRNIRTRFTTGLHTDSNPIWSPDGRFIAFGRSAGQTSELRLQAVSGPDNDVLYSTNRTAIQINDWSRNGNLLLVSKVGSRSAAGRDLFLLSVSGDRKLVPFVESPYDEFGGLFSPDGRWVAYNSSATGDLEVYLRPTRGTGAEMKVSPSGGGVFGWRGDGRELYFINAENEVIAVEIVRSGEALTIGKMQMLFRRTPIMSEMRPFADGQRFLINRVIEPSEKDPISLVTNWTAKIGNDK